MRLWAIADLHLSSPSNYAALEAMPPFGDDWLIVAGDVAESLERFAAGLALLRSRFDRVIWVPGNHDLWTVPGLDGGSAAKYDALVSCARALDVATPEDPFLTWPGPGGPHVIAPLFLLYDFSFRPGDVAPTEVIAWAREIGNVCSDEIMLDPAPHRSTAEWCAARCALSEARLDALGGAPTILVNHYPLRQDLVHIPRIPRFTPWCGTTITEDWHRRFGARVAISGHLHVRRTDRRDDTRFEEVSLGYPAQWDRARGVAGYLRQILPDPGAD